MYRIDRHDVAVEDESIWELDDAALFARLASLPSAPHALIQQSEHWGLRDLHTNACGDFTLMSAAHWHLVRGQPRDPTVLSLDIDSLVMHAAAANGVRTLAAGQSHSLALLKASQTISFGALANKTFGDPDFAVSASASSGLLVSFSASGSCTISPPACVPT